MRYSDFTFLNTEKCSNLYYHLDFHKKDNSKFPKLPPILSKLKTDEGQSIKELLKYIHRESCRYKNDSTNIISIFEVANTIIPISYFGHPHNKTRFFKTIKRLLKAVQHDFIYTSTFHLGFLMESITWLKLVPEKFQQKLLTFTNIVIMDYVVKPYILNFYHILKVKASHEIKFIPKSKWQWFYDNNFNSLLQRNYLIPVPENINEEDKWLVRGYLKLYPKTFCETLDCRAYIRAIPNVDMKVLNKKIYKLAKHFLIANVDITKSWHQVVAYKQEKGQIYGLKLDIADAYGNVDVQCLKDIIQFADLFTIKEKEFILRYLDHPIVIVKRKKANLHFKWNHGVLQGDIMSTSLNNLFLCYLEKKHLEHLLNRNTMVFLRKTDDYLICSTNFFDIQKMKETFQRYFKLNESKTVEISKQRRKLNFSGYTFNFKNGEAKKHYKVTNVRSVFKISSKVEVPQHKAIQFLREVLSYQRNQNYFSKIDLSSTINSEERVLKNIYRGFVFVAFKFDSAYSSFKEFINLNDFCPLLKEGIRIYSEKIYNSYISKNPKKEERIFNSAIIIRTLAFKAFVQVLKRRGSHYDKIVECFRNSSRKGYAEILTRKYFSKIPKCFLKIKKNQRIGV